MTEVKLKPFDIRLAYQIISDRLDNSAIFREALVNTNFRDRLESEFSLCLDATLRLTKGKALSFTEMAKNPPALKNELKELSQKEEMGLKLSEHQQFALRVGILQSWLNHHHRHASLHPEVYRILMDISREYLKSVNS